MAESERSAEPTTDATIADPPTPTEALPRSVRLVRVVVLLLSAMTIVFTAILHENLGFDRVVIATTAAALALAHLVEWIARKPRRNPASLLQALASAGATVGIAVAQDAVLVAVVIAAWALIGALLEFISAAIGLVERRESTALGAMGILLALAVLLVREDPVAVIGFFGVYLLIAGVYLGISAFDQRVGSAADGAAAVRA